MSNKIKYFNQALILIAIIMGLVIIIGTIIALPRRSAKNEVSAADNIPLDGFNVFSGIGRLRIPLSNSSTMILSIAFPYPADDKIFSEELAVKIGDFRSIAAEYFSSLPAEKLIYIDEEAAKSEILKRYNAGLRLGQITTLYFSDLLVIDSYE